jgi:large subunit ribosomal protein L29
MKAAIRKLSDTELSDRVNEARDQLFRLRIKHATQQLEKTADLRRARRDLARALTLEAERKEGRHERRPSEDAREASFPTRWTSPSSSK